ncbi:MAG: glycoside hydrolase family 65 [Lachnospiraceae bacterium]|jgi:hypothetical protein|nr:glycoside hydrolase family 65 [Lachnospiraceae bacterium]
MIDRKSLVRRHNPVLTAIAHDSPLSVGNGDFAFTADVTGLQSLDSYQAAPLCTMSAWGWHTACAEAAYTLDDVQMTVYERGGAGGCYALLTQRWTVAPTAGTARVFTYPVECKEGNEAAYHWLRQNPHRLNLARIMFLWQGKPLQDADISDIRQELDLYTGVLTSAFRVGGYAVAVTTVCAREADTLGFCIETDAPSESLAVGLAFPYGSPEKAASDWQSPEKHMTEVSGQDGTYLFTRTLDKDSYCVFLNIEEGGTLYPTGNAGFQPAQTACRGSEDGGGLRCTDSHYFIIDRIGQRLTFTVAFLQATGGRHALRFAQRGTVAPTVAGQVYPLTFAAIRQNSAAFWQGFWENGSIADFSGCTDARAGELERRMVLSMYLTAVHSSGRMPPAETGLACNSWYGKFHTEMHILHAGWFPLWGRPQLLTPSLAWYEGILANAKTNAARNGYRGARWPKMVGPEGLDSPSPIAPLLIWQQPHLIYMLTLVSHSLPESERPRHYQRYWRLVRETADFMASFAEYNEETGEYELLPPLIPVQENHAPMEGKNPTFELCYWRFALGLAYDWSEAAGEPQDEWKRVAEAMAVPKPIDGLYQACQDGYDTFVSFASDHPSMLFAWGFVPPATQPQTESGRGKPLPYEYTLSRTERGPGKPGPYKYTLSREAMLATADRVLECWDWQSLWGWDFALMAMTYASLGEREKALDILLVETDKNSYVISGNNYQRGRDDLPLYLPGNGALLFALAFLLDKLPDNGKWAVRHEGFTP